MNVVLFIIGYVIQYGIEISVILEAPDLGYRDLRFYVQIVRISMESIIQPHSMILWLIGFTKGDGD